MKVLIIFACLLATTYACQDRASPSKCSLLKYLCKSEVIVKIYCKKTCGLCTNTVPTSGPSRPILTQAPSHPILTQAPGSCGLRQVSSGKVIGGKDAKPGDWPWQILLQSNGRGICGGTIINKRYIVTAAHCVARNPSPVYYSVVVGETDRTKTDGPESTYQAEAVIVHPSYGRLNNDIALIKLNKDIAFGKFVQPACLPDADIAVGSQNCFITGWGKIVHPGNMHTQLQQANMPPVDSKVCYAKNRRHINIPISPAMVCAGEGGINPISGCHGDSGGPYVCEVNGRWEIHGAVSHGSPRCKSTETYTVFARVKYFRQWISDKMRQYGDYE